MDGSPRETAERLDAWIIETMRTHAIFALRVALGLVFVWFGALKVAGESPIEHLIAAIAVLIPADALIVLLGVWEIVIGLGLLFAIALRTTLLLFFLQMLGTFSLLVLRPDIAFQTWNPLLLTTEGEFVIKNLILLSAGLVVGGTIHHRREAPETAP